MTGIILMYHRVATPQEDPYGLAVHPERFAEHVERLCRLDCVVPLPEILRSGRATKIAITFDDGYADNATAAAPLLAAAGLPATYFITSGLLGRRLFWWDRLATAFLGEHPLPDGVDVTIGDRSLWVALNDPDARRTGLQFLHRRLRPLPPGELVATVDDLLERLAVPGPRDDELTMSVEQLRTMATLPLVEIGAHTRTHLQLSGQREELQRQEVLGSVEDLSVLLGQPVRSFAYPFGSESAVGDLAPRLARDAGCIVACSTVSDAVTRWSKPHQLPRMNVRDWTGPELAAQIEISRLVVAFRRLAADSAALSRRAAWLPCRLSGRPPTRTGERREYDRRGGRAMVLSRLAEMQLSALAGTARKVLTRAARASVGRPGRRLVLTARFGDLGRTQPLTNWGTGRGMPVGRWYIERFLQRHASAVSGRVLEVKSDLYGSRLGASEVEVLDIDPANVDATLVGDLCDPGTLQPGIYDAAIITQTLQLVDDPPAAIRHLVTSLRPGAALLFTVPCLSRLASPTDRWRWTPAGVRHLLATGIPSGATVDVQGFGNSLSCRAFLFGLAAEDLAPADLAVADIDYPLLVGACVRLPS